MKLDEGQCAECGRKLDAGYEIEPYNTELDRYGSFRRPYFCSAYCADDAIDARVNSELDQQERYLEGAKWDEIYRSEGAESLTPEFFEYQRRKQEFLADRPRRFEMMAEEARRHYCTLYFQNRSAKEEVAREKERTRLDREIRRLEAVVARDQERAEAAAERKAEAERRAQERRAEIERRVQEKQDEIDRKAREQEERLRPIPFEMPSDHALYEGVHCLGPNGSGKTTLAQEFIVNYVRRPDCPSLVVVDPKGTLIDRIVALKTYDPSRLVIIDATHEYPAKIGMFVKPAGANSEQLVNQAISTYKYILKSADFAFTPKQGILFDHLVRLMFATNGTLTSLIEFLREYPGNPQAFAQQIRLLPPNAQKFFKLDFQRSFLSTADEVNVRLQEIDGDPMLKRMLDTPECRVNFSDCIQSGKIVLVNSGMSTNPEGSKIIGRFVIAMVLNAVYIRARLPDTTWRPTLLICDEFQQYIDSAKTPELLRYPREFNFGSMIMHHTMYSDEITQGVRTAISTLTGVKFCARPKGADRTYMASDFGCEPEYLAAQRRSETHIRFATVQRDKYDEVVSVQIRKGNLNAYPKRTQAEIDAIERENTLRVHGPTAPEPTVGRSISSQVVPELVSTTENISEDEWG